VRTLVNRGFTTPKAIYELSGQLEEQRCLHAQSHYESSFLELTAIALRVGGGRSILTRQPCRFRWMQASAH
jgi:hypothetical protein